MHVQLGILVLFSSLVLCSLSPPRANTENGAVVGTLKTTPKGKTYQSFEGIPYAKPPIDDLRFKEPELLEKKWIGEWKATSPGSICLQYDEFTESEDKQGFGVVGDEDCLFINVYTSDAGVGNKDVLVWIHGGAFMFGSSAVLEPVYILDKEDVVFVSFNYRLGPLGFLSTGDGVIPGNNGLKDQVAALSWVQRNIANFGGNPNKVTIAGESAGGASTHLQLLSSMSNGLFSRGYSYSGSALCPWVLVTDAPQKTKKLADLVGCPTTDSRTILKCLNRRPARQIVQQMEHFQVWLYNPFTVFGPVVEVGSARPFIDQHPRDLIKKGLGKDVPWIAGFDSEEGLYPAATFIEDDELLGELNEEWNHIAPSLLFFNATYPVSEHPRIAEAIRHSYLADKNISRETISELVQLLGDRLFILPVAEAAALQARSNSQPVYLYRFQYAGTKSQSQMITKSDTLYGVSHVEDMFYVIRYHGENFRVSESDIKIGDNLLDILLTFVKTGRVPAGLHWKPVSSSPSDPFTFLKIASPVDINTETDPDLGNFQTLSKIFIKEANYKDEL